MSEIERPNVELHFIEGFIDKEFSEKKLHNFGFYKKKKKKREYLKNMYFHSP